MQHPVPVIERYVQGQEENEKERIKKVDRAVVSRQQEIEYKDYAEVHYSYYYEFPDYRLPVGSTSGKPVAQCSVNYYDDSYTYR